MDMQEHNSTWDSFMLAMVWGSVVVGGAVAFLMLWIILGWNFFVAGGVTVIGCVIGAYIFYPAVKHAK